MREAKPLSLFKICRSLCIGVIVFGLFWYSPLIMLWLSGARLSPAAAPVAQEPIYTDKNGRRINEADHFIRVGYERAEKEAISQHEVCKSALQGWERHGCFKYVDEHFTPPHIKQDWGSNKTTAQCEVEVRRYYEYRLHAERVKGNDRYRDRDYMTELNQCHMHDDHRSTAGVQPLLERLNQLIRKVEDGERINNIEKSSVVTDLATVMALPDSPYKSSYQERSRYFFKLADGEVEPLGKERLNLSCADLWAGLKRLYDADVKDAAEMDSFKRSDGLIQDPEGRRTALNQKRIDRLTEVSRFEFNIKRLGCHPKEGANAGAGQG